MLRDVYRVPSPGVSTDCSCWKQDYCKANIACHLQTSRLGVLIYSYF